MSNVNSSSKVFLKTERTWRVALRTLVFIKFFLIAIMDLVLRIICLKITKGVKKTKQKGHGEWGISFLSPEGLNFKTNYMHTLLSVLDVFSSIVFLREPKILRVDLPPSRSAPFTLF